MSKQNFPGSGNPDKPRPRHPLKGAARQKLQRIEHSAVDAYHTIEDHNARELRQDVKGVLTRLAEWTAVKRRAFKLWYLAQPLYLRIAYGLTLLPAVALVVVPTLLLVKFGGPLLLTTVLVIKLSMTLIKTLLFIGYILYKILKTLMLWYYTLTRLYLGRKAKNRRFAMARAGDFPVQPVTLAGDFTFVCDKKYLDIEQAGKGSIRVLFSYLRYALVGHAELFGKLKHHWRHYLRIWEPRTRNELKALLAPLGDALFSPHKRGAQITDERVLVPGDAELLKISVADAGTLKLSFRIRWVKWHFQLRKQLKFMQIRREHHQDIWNVQTRITQNSETAAVSSGRMSTEPVT
jgi:hypothetical protein